MSAIKEKGGVVKKSLRRPRSGVLVFVLVALTVAALVPVAMSGCGSSSAAGVIVVTMKDLKFNPSTVTIQPGDTVRWVNEDKFTAHTSTAKGWQQGTQDPLKWNSMPMNPGDSFEHTFDTPGSFDYFCMVHPYMTGVVNVTGAGGTVPSTTSSSTTTTSSSTTTTEMQSTTTSTVPTTATTQGGTATTTGGSATTGGTTTTT